MTKLKASDLIFALGCGLTGSCAGFFAKLFLEKYERPFNYLDNRTAAYILLVAVKIFLFCGFVYSNAKMVEYKIRSFALIGASLTVIIAFAFNYMVSCILEIFMNHNWINLYQVFGFLMIMTGVGF